VLTGVTDAGSNEPPVPDRELRDLAAAADLVIDGW
jgi:hypothetical protein